MESEEELAEERATEYRFFVSLSVNFCPVWHMFDFLWVRLAVEKWSEWIGQATRESQYHREKKRRSEAV